MSTFADRVFCGRPMALKNKRILDFVSEFAADIAFHGFAVDEAAEPIAPLKESNRFAHAPLTNDRCLLRIIQHVAFDIDAEFFFEVPFVRSRKSLAPANCGGALSYPLSFFWG